LAPEKLTPQTVLRRVPNLTVRIESDNQLQIFWDGKETRCGPGALSVLDVFSQPHSLAQAFEHLQTLSTGAQDWINLTSSVLQLYRAGVLQDELEPRLIPTSGGFDAAVLHILMLNDRDRTSRLIAAISETVHAGDIVLDIGTGTGVLAVAAARAGAGKVYAVEASSIAGVAKTTFEANGLADRITLIEGWSTQIELPERADVLVSEILGDEGLGESVLEVTLDARKRLLKPDARFVPGKIRILGLPVTVPKEKLNRYLFTTEATDNWRSWYGIEFGPLVDISRKHPPTIFLKPVTTSHWKLLGEPVLLTEIDLTSFSRSLIETEVVGEVKESGTFNGFTFFFETELSPANCLSTHPGTVSADSNWRNCVQILPAPFEVSPGDRYRVKYQYRTDGLGFSWVDIQEDKSAVRG
jgi:SAM-dependent methyltransferase